MCVFLIFACFSSGFRRFLGFGRSFFKKTLFWGGKNAGGRRAQKYRAFGHKSLFFTKQRSFFFWGGGTRRGPPRTEEQGFFVTKVRFLLNQRVFLFVGAGGKPPEAAAHRSTGLLVTKVSFLLKKRSFWGEKNAGGRRDQKYRAFGYKSELFTQKALFWGGKKPPEALRAGPGPKGLGPRARAHGPGPPGEQAAGRAT